MVHDRYFSDPVPPIIHGHPARCWDQLLALRWIPREEGAGTRSAFESALAAQGIAIGALQAALSLPSSDAVRSAVMAGPFATVVSELVMASHLQAGLLARENFQLAARTFQMLRHHERYKSKASVALEQLIRASSASLGEWGKQALAGAAPGNRRLAEK